MSGRLESHFRNLVASQRKALVPYVTAGHPDLETTLQLLVELDSAGADVIEVGVPFSDPIADGPTIQRASHQALQAGFRLPDLLAGLKRLRGQLSCRLMLFSYLNPLVQHGLDRLADELIDCGVDGILMSDLIPEEALPFADPFRRRGIDTVFLAAPTSGRSRLQSIVSASSGFIYLVSRTGVTGASASLPAEVEGLVKEIREVSDLPVAVGFGISTPEQVRSVWEVADGAVVGSALVAVVERFREKQADCVREAGRFLRSLAAVRGPLSAQR